MFNIIVRRLTNLSSLYCKTNLLSLPSERISTLTNSHTPHRPPDLFGTRVGGLTGGVDEEDWMRSWVPEEFRRVRGRGGVSYVFLEGCHKRLGCTLVC